MPMDIFLTHFNPVHILGGNFPRSVLIISSHLIPPIGSFSTGISTKTRYTFLVSPTQGNSAALIHLITQDISGEYELNVIVHQVRVLILKICKYPLAIQMDVKCKRKLK
jgi:hypothetical protein